MKHKSFTLIELLIVIAIIALAIVLLTNNNATVIITKLDDLKSQVVLPDGVSLDGEWSVRPRYI